jgi:hypothetical protein
MTMQRTIMLMPCTYRLQSYTPKHIKTNEPGGPDRNHEKDKPSQTQDTRLKSCKEEKRIVRASLAVVPPHWNNLFFRQPGTTFGCQEL